MKKVLIAIDYNPSSQYVAEAGYELAGLMNAEVCLIHVRSNVTHYEMRYPTFMGYDGFDLDPNVEIMNEMNRVTEDYLNSVAKHLNDPAIKTYLAEGDAAKALLDYSDQWKANVLVMGTHSHSALEKLLMGNVASTVLEKTKIPVYMVPIKRE